MNYIVTVLDHRTSKTKEYAIEAADKSTACTKAFIQATHENKDVPHWMLEVIGIGTETQEVE
jgi:hypothetical protein